MVGELFVLQDKDNQLLLIPSEEGIIYAVLRLLFRLRQILAGSGRMGRRAMQYPILLPAEPLDQVVETIAVNFLDAPRFLFERSDVLPQEGFYRVVRHSPVPS